jgi:hypothetical protein
MTESDRGRLDSRLEAEGAEFLVLAHLLIEGIQAIKAYTRFPGYDLIAADPENLECDFVVLVALNRGFRYRRRKGLQSMKVGVLPSCTFSPSTCSDPSFNSPEDGRRFTCETYPC